MDNMYNTLKLLKPKYQLPSKKVNMDYMTIFKKYYNQNTSTTNEKEVHNSTNGDN